MNIDTNSTSLNGMLAAQMQINQSAQVLADVANTVGDPQNMEVTQDVIDAITSQIPETIAYKANAQGIETQQAVVETLLDLKA